MRSSLRYFIQLGALALLPGSMFAQNPPIVANDSTTVVAYRVVMGEIETPEREPIANASVEIFSNPPRTAETDRQGHFQIEYQFVNPLVLASFTAIMRISKKGYPDCHKLVEFSGDNKLVTFFIILRKPQDDPSELPQADLVQAISSPLRQIGTGDGLSSKYAKDYARGVQEFLDRFNHLDRAVQYLSKVAAGQPACLRCRTVLATAKLAWGDWAGANNDLGEAINAIAKDPSLGRPDPFLAYGVLLSWQHKPDAALPYFQKALQFSPGNALTLQELGRAQCQLFEWDTAKATLATALAAGAGPEARFLHAEALLWAGSAQEARNELDAYLQGRDINKMTPRVRALSDRMDERKKDAKAYSQAAAKMQARGEEPVDYLHDPPKGLNNFEPATDQSLLDSILSSVGRNVAEFYAKFPNTSSIEVIHQEMLSQKGKVGLTQKQKFSYLCLIPAMPWGPSTNEYRADSTGSLAHPKGIDQNFMLTTGFVAAPLVFHPAYQNGAAYHYWGRQKARGSSSYVVAFAQKPANSRIYGSFSTGNVTRQTYFQGLVWVDTTTYQIVRLTSDLLTPMPQVKLNKETTDIEFNQVQFNSANQKFWLPQEVTVTLDWNGHTLRNRHEYSDFHVFNVDQKQLIALPKTAPSAQPPTGQ